MSAPSALIQKTYNQSLSFDQYMHLMRNLVDDGSSTGPNQSEAFVHYTKMNLARMERWLKQINLDDAGISKHTNQVIWLIATESWCGDAAHNIPFIEAFANAAQIESRYFLRDENPEMMQFMLTNGGLSIPKLMIVNKANWHEEAQWGPRPQAAQQLVLDFKANPAGRTYQDLQLELQKWYNANKNQDLKQELCALTGLCLVS